MKDAAYSLATLEQLTHTIEIFDITITSNSDDTEISYRVQLVNTASELVGDYFEQFTAKAFAARLCFTWDELVPRVKTYTQILGLKLHTIEDIGYCCFLHWKQKIEDAISYAEIINDQLKYRMHGITVTKPIKTLVNTILGAESILDGLHIVDYAGSHYTVVTPAKKVHLTTASTCSCREFTFDRRCSHTKAVSLLPTHRQLLLQQGVLSVNYITSF